MKKTTLMLVAAVIVLGGVTLVVTSTEETAERKAVAVEGYAPPDKLAERDKQGMLDAPVRIDYPVDAVVIEREGETIELKRSGDGEDVRWSLVKPVEAPAVKFAVEKMIKPFETKTASVYSTPVQDKDLPRFDLEPERRIHVTLKSGDGIWNGVDWVIGKVAEGDGQTTEGEDKDTWIALAGDLSTVYRLSGKDLRTPFEQSVSDLRDKKVFDATPTDLVGVTIQPPKGQKIRLAGERTEKEAPPKKPAAQGAKKDDDAPKKTWDVTWSIAEPAGVEADKSVDGVARSLANLRVREFVPASEAPKDALEGEVWTLSAATHDGKELKLKLASEPKGEDDFVWAQVPGREELIKLDKYAANNLRKTVGDLRDKALFDVSEEQVTRVTFAPEGGKVVIEKAGEGWKFVDPARPYAADPSTVMRTLLNARATRWANPDEVAAAAKALETPEFTAGLAAGDKAWALTVGPKMEEDPHKNQRWARLTPAGGEPGTPFLLQDFTASRFRKGVDDLRAKKVFGFKGGDIQRLEVAWPDGKTKIELERPPEGAKLALLGLPEGKKAKPAAINTLENTLPNLRVKDFVDDKKAADVGLTPDKAYVVKAALADGTTAELWISKEKLKSDPYATASAGPLAGQIFTINTYQADNLLKELPELVE